ncbi:hypothetical protein [Micromonospora viridifaciens]|uniref:hypothetical protein n=1 Tax=Micromonospora viridifaciens TaxID=1881 RepID=UPI0012FD43DE|nr:hypothetical protein [Micromonospora viridifaciens]
MERENDRRHRAYDTEVEAWHRRHDELTRLRIEAAGFLGCMQPRTGLPVHLDDDEVVYRVLPAVELVEAKARHVAGLPAPGLTVAAACVGAPARALRGGLQVVDAVAVVTSHRVAFAGRERRREWRYADMVGLAHHPDVPLTLLHTTQGRRLPGLLVPAAITVNFRFYLTLAFAAAIGQRAAVVAQIDALLDAHRRALPVPPPLAEADDARRPPRRPDRLVAAGTALVAFAFATLSAGPPKSEQPGQRNRTKPDSGGIAAPIDAGNSSRPSAQAPPPSRPHRTATQAGP